MSDFANALADLLTKMDAKLDALGEKQAALDAKLERYSAFLVKKMNETADTVTNVQTAQAKLVTDSLEKMGHQVYVMERQIAGRLSTDEQNNAVMEKLDRTAENLQHTVERSINLISYHGRTIEQALTEKTEQLAKQMQTDLDRHQAEAEALSIQIEQAFARFDDILIANPEAVPENPEAVPENPEAVPDNPEIAVFENPEAVPENPEPVIETGDDRGGF